MNIMFRGKNKRLPEPPSEYSLNSIKSIETDSAAGEGDDYDKRTSNFELNPNESSHLVPKRSGYDIYT